MQESLHVQAPDYKLLSLMARKEVPSDVEDVLRPYVQKFDFLVGYVTTKIVEGERDLAGAIDRVLEDRFYHLMRNELASMVPYELMTRVLIGKPTPTRLPAVPAAVANDVSLAFKLEYELMRRVHQLLLVKGRPSVAEVVHLEQQHPAGVIGAGMPAKMRAAMLAYKIGEVCSLAIMSDRIVNPALASELTSRWLHGLRANIGVTYVFGEDLPELSKHLVPESYRLSKAELVAEAEEERKGLALAYEQVATTGKGYPEVYLPDDDEDDYPGDDDEAR